MVDSLLTIAGTDPSGGAGVQVDLQVFRDFGFHGLSVVSAVVCQNTRGSWGYEPVSADGVSEQLRVLLGDIQPSGIKIGMLPTPEVVEVVAERLVAFREESGFKGPVVFDPVLASSSEHELVGEGGVEMMRRVLIPEVDLLTPNLGEAAVLLGHEIAGRAAFERAAGELMGLGARAVLLKAGHLRECGRSSGVKAGENRVPGVMLGAEFSGAEHEIAGMGMGRQISDVYADAAGISPLRALPAIPEDVRGTGCQLSSAVLAALVRAEETRQGRVEAIERGRAYLNELLHKKRRAIGSGRPVIVRGVGLD